MKKLIKRFVVIWIVLAIAWTIGKMVAGETVPLRVRTSCEVCGRLIPRDRMQRVACRGSPILATYYKIVLNVCTD